MFTTEAVEPYAAPAIGFALERIGEATLPADFVWPVRKGRKLDVLLQIDLRDLAGLEPATLLPREGLLTFFYDLDEQPWGFDPKDLDGFRVVHTSGTARAGSRLRFFPVTTYPHHGSRAYERMATELDFSDDEEDRYFDFATGHEKQQYRKAAERIGSSVTPRTSRTTCSSKRSS